MPLDKQVHKIIEDRLLHITAEENKLKKQKALINKALGKKSEPAPPAGRGEAPRP
jgi:hypothetical protein